MVFKLSSELVDAAKGSGDAIHKKKETHRMAEARASNLSLMRDVIREHTYHYISRVVPAKRKPLRALASRPSSLSRFPPDFFLLPLLRPACQQPQRSPHTLVSFAQTRPTPTDLILFSHCPSLLSRPQTKPNNHFPQSSSLRLLLHPIFPAPLSPLSRASSSAAASPTDPDRSAAASSSALQSASSGGRAASSQQQIFPFQPVVDPRSPLPHRNHPLTTDRPQVHHQPTTPPDLPPTAPPTTSDHLKQGRLRRKEHNRSIAVVVTAAEEEKRGGSHFWPPYFWVCFHGGAWTHELPAVVVREIHAPPLSLLFQRSSQHYSSDSEVSSTILDCFGSFCNF
ncbi:hypothetical protein NC653_040765 [Populus alba x Populus x berolinensis]|uniref:Small ribosomal subunit protein uS7 domain-containing protein n=1 Tax=Populus alba x Populus x berolinensis TaxID=444605 RepID=A0AAD6PP66_9ROSI|nr:hypothetical protein NC653_040765 [Populus alba x Populus x berolinensis]